MPSSLFVGIPGSALMDIHVLSAISSCTYWPLLLTVAALEQLPHGYLNLRLIYAVCIATRFPRHCCCDSVLVGMHVLLLIFGIYIGRRYWRLRLLRSGSWLNLRLHPPLSYVFASHRKCILFSYWVTVVTTASSWTSMFFKDFRHLLAVVIGDCVF